MQRLFVALRPPPSVRDALLAAQGGVAGARWQSDEQLHLTLRFVGEIDRRTQRELEDRLSQVLAARFELTIAGVGHFSRGDRPRALWAAFAPNAALRALQAAVESACRAAGLDAEARTFVPHVTLARLAASAAGPGEWVARHGDLSAPIWPVSSFRLYESQLNSGGARYSAIVEWALEPAPPVRREGSANTR